VGFSSQPNVLAWRMIPLWVSLYSLDFYLRVLGSLLTQAKRRERLSESLLDCQHGPFGLNINAQTPEEIV
jgi:xanthine/CO dehydrogenase XdhC/CoxF family maturation factor